MSGDGTSTPAQLPTIDGPNQDNLIVCAYSNFATSVDKLRQAMRIDITAEERKALADEARGELNCAGAHLSAAIDNVAPAS